FSVNRVTLLSPREGGVADGPATAQHQAGRAVAEHVRRRLQVQELAPAARAVCLEGRGRRIVHQYRITGYRHVGPGRHRLLPQLGTAAQVDHLDALLVGGPHDTVLPVGRDRGPAGRADPQLLAVVRGQEHVAVVAPRRREHVAAARGVLALLAT